MYMCDHRCYMHPRRHLTFLLSFTDTPTTAIYTLSLHDALPISTTHSLGRLSLVAGSVQDSGDATMVLATSLRSPPLSRDRKSTRLNSSHANISYAVFCLKKKKEN